jgi:hypothetical protein
MAVLAVLGSASGYSIGRRIATVTTIALNVAVTQT